LAEEATLDVEYAHAIAPGARILLAEMQDTSSDAAEQYILSHYRVDVISQSFSMTEQTLPKSTVDAMHAVYERAAAQHVTIVASSGDSGAANTGPDGVTYFAEPATQYPASDPLVTTVGGTDLHLDGYGDRVSPDTVWNDGGTSPQASGGGKSVLFARPSYQDSVRGVTGNTRGVPDISMSAACSAPVTVYHSFAGEAAGLSPACGTSEAAPCSRRSSRWPPSGRAMPLA
jgi:subtilase family serine protease